MTEVRATARLQFHKEFTLDDAVEWVDYFAGLGVSHLYASPLFKARPGSMHGYDVLDPTCINPELGGEAALERLVNALRARNMGLIIDIVSNHMAVGGGDNPWWLALLEWGRLSPYGEFPVDDTGGQPIMQVVDRQAAETLAANFGSLRRHGRAGGGGRSCTGRASLASR